MPSSAPYSDVPRLIDARQYSQNRNRLTERNRVGAIAMAHFADKLHVDKQKIDRVKSAVLLALIGSGLGLCVLGAAVYDIGRVFSVW